MLPLLLGVFLSEFGPLCGACVVVVLAVWQGGFGFAGFGKTFVIKHGYMVVLHRNEASHESRLRALDLFCGIRS